MMAAKDTELAPVGASADTVRAMAALPRDLAVVKMEHETIMSLAAVRPRDPVAILQHLKDQLAAYKSFAQTAIYAKPVGRDRDGREKFARGLSVRMAEAIAEAYGFCKVRSTVIPIDNDTVRVEATFTDYQRGRVWEDSGIISKNYTRYGGGADRHSDDRFYNVVVKAETSRRIREVILRSVPPGLRSELTILVDDLLDEFLDDKTVEKVVAQFSQKNVTPGMIEGLLGKRLSSLTKDDRKALLGVWNSLKDGGATVQDIFGTSTPMVPDDDTGQASKTQAAGIEDELCGPEAPTTPAPAPEPTPVDTQPAEPAETTPEAVGVIGADQFRLLVQMYSAIDAATQKALQTQLGFTALSQLNTLPVDQFDDVHRTFIDAHAAQVLPDKVGKPVEGAEAALTSEQLFAVRSKYDALGIDNVGIAKKKAFRVWRFGSPNVPINDLGRPSIHTYDAHLAWFDAHKE